MDASCRQPSYRAFLLNDSERIQQDPIQFRQPQACPLPVGVILRKSLMAFCWR
jgi:hypothetical protein